MHFLAPEVSPSLRFASYSGMYYSSPKKNRYAFAEKIDTNMPEKKVASVRHDIS